MFQKGKEEKGYMTSKREREKMEWKGKLLSFVTLVTRAVSVINFIFICK
jgi:hypothetical protein